MNTFFNNGNGVSGAFRRLTRRGQAALAAVMAAGVLVSASGPAMAGRSGGASRTAETVLEGDHDDYTITFRGGERARVWAVGDGDIDIRVYDSDGDLVVQDRLTDSEPSVSWTPSYTQTYTICVSNDETYDVDYVLRTN